MRFDKVFIPLKGFLGDNTLATPTLDAIFACSDKVIIEAPKIVGDLLEAPWRKFDLWPRARSLRETQALIGRLQREAPTAAILISRSFRSAFACSSAGIPIRVGHDTEFRGKLLTSAVPYDKAKDEAKCYADILAPLKIEVRDTRSKLWADPVDIEAVKAKGFDATVAVQPGASGPKKLIPIQNLARLVDECIQQGHKVAILGGQDETAAGEALEQAVGGRTSNWVGKLNIKETKAALSQLKLCVGGDTGMMHVAAGVGCPTLTVFANLPASKWAHAYEPHRFIVPPNNLPRDLPVEELLDTAKSMLSM